MYIIYAILAFSILIIVHELGHFIVAKLNGIKVEEFSIGMGPKLFGVKGKETEYNLRVLPFGGFVKMLGEEEQVKDKRSFSSKSPIQKILVIGAGAFMNLVLGIVIFTILCMNNGYAETKIGEVANGTPAQEVGLQIGDELIRLDGKKINTVNDLTTGIAMAKGNPIKLQVSRGGEKITKEIIPAVTEDGGLRIGIAFEQVKNPTLLQSFGHSFLEIKSLISQTFTALKSIVTGEANLKTDVGGPITIIKMSGQMAKTGIWNLMWFMAFLSVQLAVFNLLPLPALDGGLIFIELIQMTIRKKIPAVYIERLNYIGIMLLMGLMVIVTVKDLIFPIL
ncbi:M50 family metallopeptidase [Clostridium tarantellae]|uniref:PDZ domain-containing protein n=1 Tax=Clostridium tarantellae TaxID=39493 RepID=A0A6I1MJ26_9CLOT|nr:M50 family metallopeptidase [Clostridium tarantellae]MPQ42408.1 PDZ domain-containing protein [Clostridium tarantellae]